ncbi:uncharacterized protein LOC128741026 [Sabethes cyaneus]|uniref:uncharacterized protein LOC128741026 n=1 Tax=Sabethes cyaneus TaxID=53552 RepID=UPI00237E9FCC|nr:uncharacterized protein LOC128741026 [Sabethes cyaneus]
MIAAECEQKQLRARAETTETALSEAMKKTSEAQETPRAPPDLNLRSDKRNRETPGEKDEQKKTRNNEEDDPSRSKSSYWRTVVSQKDKQQRKEEKSGRKSPKSSGVEGTRRERGTWTRSQQNKCVEGTVRIERRTNGNPAEGGLWRNADGDDSSLSGSSPQAVPCSSILCPNVPYPEQQQQQPEQGGGPVKMQRSRVVALSCVCERTSMFASQSRSFQLSCRVSVCAIMDGFGVGRLKRKLASSAQQQHSQQQQQQHRCQ